MNKINDLHRLALIGALSELTDEKFDVKLEIELFDGRFVVTDSSGIFTRGSKCFVIDEELTSKQLKLFAKIIWTAIQCDRERQTMACQIAEVANKRIDDLLKIIEELKTKIQN